MRTYQILCLVDIQCLVPNNRLEFVKLNWIHGKVRSCVRKEDMTGVIVGRLCVTRVGMFILSVFYRPV